MSHSPQQQSQNHTLIGFPLTHPTSPSTSLLFPGIISQRYSCTPVLSSSATVGTIQAKEMMQRLKTCLGDSDKSIFQWEPYRSCSQRAKCKWAVQRRAKGYFSKSVANATPWKSKARARTKSALGCLICWSRKELSSPTRAKESSGNRRH